MMKVDKLLKKRISRKKFLALLGGTIIAVPFLSKTILAKTFLRKTTGVMMDIDDFVTEAGRSALATFDIDFSKGADEFKTKTLVGNSTFTFSNPTLGKMILLELTGNFTVTLPATAVVVNGDYCPNLGKNYLYLLCNDEDTPEYQAVWTVTV